MGYILHPSIKSSIKDKQTPRILDLGTGTGIWAIEAGRAFRNAIIVGLDAADNQFPPPGTLPINISFAKYNFFDPVPAELAGTFDIVHLSFVNAALFRSGPDAIIKHVFELLKPGGWVQWREILNNQDIVLDSNTLKPAGDLASTKFVDKHMGFFSANDWARKMPEVLTNVGGFVDASMEVVKMDPALLSLETQLLRWSTQETLSTMGRALGTEEAKRGATEAIEDTEQKLRGGKVLHWQFMVGIARRPE